MNRVLSNGVRFSGERVQECYRQAGMSHLYFSVVPRPACVFRGLCAADALVGRKLPHVSNWQMSTSAAISWFDSVHHEVGGYVA